MRWLVFVVGAVLSWGAYGVLLHRGQVMLGNPLKALLCVGVAYFLIGVLIPVATLASQGNLSGFNQTGLMVATIAGALGAIGAGCIIWAFRTRRPAGLRHAARLRRRPHRQRAALDGDPSAEGRAEPDAVRGICAGVTWVRAWCCTTGLRRSWSVVGGWWLTTKHEEIHHDAVTGLGVAIRALRADAARRARRYHSSSRFAIGSTARIPSHRGKPSLRQILAAGQMTSNAIATM